MIDPGEITEQVGYASATLARQLLEEDLDARPIVVLAGEGRNGAAALAAVHSLWEMGAWVQTICVFANEPKERLLTAKLEVLQSLGLPFAWAEGGWELPPCDLLIDAILDPEHQEDPQGAARTMILLANSSAASILSLYAPSGVHIATGRCFSPYVQAAATLLVNSVPLALDQEPVRTACGTLYLYDKNKSIQLIPHTGTS